MTEIVEKHDDEDKEVDTLMRVAPAQIKHVAQRPLHVNLFVSGVKQLTTDEHIDPGNVYVVGGGLIFHLDPNS